MRWADDFDEIGKNFRELQKQRWGDTQPGEAKTVPASVFVRNPNLCETCNRTGANNNALPFCSGACGCG